MADNILVFLETERNELKKISLETLTLARTMADGSGQAVATVLIGRSDKNLVGNVSRYGGDSVYLVSEDGLSPHDSDGHVNLLEIILRNYKDALLLMGDTPLSREVAPRLSARLQSGLISGCVELNWKASELVGRRAIMNGKAHSTVACSGAPFNIVTISAGAYDSKESPRKEPTEIRNIPLSSLKPSEVQFINYVKGDPATIGLTEAETIIAVGRGLERVERLDVIKQLASILGASLGGTRVAVDMKWMPLERQIGITGLTVAPRLFVSCGISGQYPHTVGLDASETIIVINKDRDAPMFKLATLGIIGKMEEIVPALTEYLKRELESRRGQVL